MQLKTEICKKSITANNAGGYLIQSKDTKDALNGKKSALATTPTNILPLNCVDWSSNDDIYFVSDDGQIYKWNLNSRDAMEIAKLPDDFIPTDMHWLLINSRNGGAGVGGGGGGGGGGGSRSSDTLLITSNDGRFIILNKSARVERCVSAHSASIVAGRWSPDGAGLLTAGEDGIVKIWSRSGMLRSTVLQSDEAIRCARWCPNSTSIALSQGGQIAIKPLAANSKLLRAHEGIILSLSWSSDANVIASGGEDYRFKLWDCQGNNLFTSSIEENSITTVAFNPEKDILLVGTFNMIKLCSINGWSYSSTRFNEPVVGSFLCLTWWADGTQVACGTSTGQLIIGYIIEQQVISRNLKAITSGQKTLTLTDINNGTTDVLDFNERIINFALGYGHLIVATCHQVHIYNENHINTPIIIDGRTDVRVIEVGKKLFMVLDSISIWIYTYTGRLHLNPRYPGSQAQLHLLNHRSVSLGLDTLAIKDYADSSVIYVYDLIPGNTQQYEPFTLRSKTQYVEIAACRAGTPNDQFIAMIDSNRELYISESRNLNSSSNERAFSSNSNNLSYMGEIYKIGSQVTAIKWASESNILVGVHDNSYSIWYCPGEGASDPTIISLTTVTMDTVGFGKNIGIESFEDAIVTFHCSGARLPINVNINCEILHRILMEGQWQTALKLCRSAKSIYLWATLAAVATRRNQLQISEDAYAAAVQVDKVFFLKYMKTLEPNSPEYMAENSLLMGRSSEAETILTHNRRYRAAIEICLRLHNWTKALELAENYENDLLAKVLSFREQYLKALQREEWEPAFLKKLTANEEEEE